MATQTTVTIHLLRTIVVLTQTLQSLPDEVMMTTKLLYHEDGKYGHTDPVNAKLCEGLLVIRTSNILKITGPKPLLLVRRIFCIFVIFLNKNDVQKDNLCLLG